MLSIGIRFPHENRIAIDPDLVFNPDRDYDCNDKIGIRFENKNNDSVEKEKSPFNLLLLPLVVKSRNNSDENQGDTECGFIPSKGVCKDEVQGNDNCVDNKDPDKDVQDCHSFFLFLKCSQFAFGIR